MSNDKARATFHPGLPQRIPFEAMAAHGAPPQDPSVDRMFYAHPGTPPWEKRRGLPAWAWVSIVLGTLFLVCGSSVLVSIFTESGPAPVVTSPSASAPVAVTGTCDKRLVGEYGLVATVEATNVTSTTRTGTVWVRWPVTGEAAQEFRKSITLAPGASAEYVVNQRIAAEQWFRTGACSFGWTA
jgi:hypothetical protein